MDTATSVAPRQAWIMAARPKTLPASVAPIVVGMALAFADGRFQWGPALGAFVCAMLLQIGSNFANDYFDFFKGADTHERLGPTRATAAGLLTPAAMRTGMLLVFGGAALVGLYLIWVGGWLIFWLGVASLLAAVAYTGGPLPFGYYGLGDLFVFLFFGLVGVGGTYYLQAHTVTLPVLVAASAVGLLVTNILVVNNLRDIETDRRANKRTFAVMIGRQGARLEYSLWLIFAYLLVIWLWLGGGHSPWVLLPLLTIPLALPLLRTIYREEGRVLNGTLAGSARLSLFFSLLLSLGLIL
ncbi:MAG TPA: 1,4-dihydroxy-2-naphthoate polyprenyltransferase [Caldilineaceae bacterium]|nr:1,4-dihydroxy-2-naphthoate polyprenyltransferase [Caldilineaceae bacterium]